MTNTTPREIFTALINRISSIPLLDDEQLPPLIRHPVLREEGAANPLRRVPVSHRHLLITLHVLFPGMVLPALDLLDRRLVTRLVLDPALSWRDAKKLEENKIKRDQVLVLEEEKKIRAEVADPDPQHPDMYIVYSSAQPSRPRKPTTTAGIGAPVSPAPAPALSKQKYVVRLKAWNCNCAAFAFASVQEALDGVSITRHRSDHGEGESEKEKESEGQRDGDDDHHHDDRWSFGGLTLPEEGNRIPTCKHLLACLLAERWGAALGEYVVDRRVGREEMAGVVADI